MNAIIVNPSRTGWPELMKRPQISSKDLDATILEIINTVRKSGDEAVKEYSQKFHDFAPENLWVTEAEITASAKKIDKDLKKAILVAKKNIEKFHKRQVEKVKKIETSNGVICWRKSVPVEKVGLYIPGGSAPLFSTLLMLAIPAKIAGCDHITVTTPANRSGNVDPAILFVAHILGLKRIYKGGGAQAIAALAYGTQTVEKVDKIFGPGNQYVTCAKKLVNIDGVAIDMLAGPSELAVYADDTCVPEFVAADLLSQAEHGADSQVVLVTVNKPVSQAGRQIIENVIQQMDEQLPLLARSEIIEKSLLNKRFIVVENEEDAFDFLNAYAPEHLIIASENAEQLATRVRNAGSVFLGNLSPESAGDYASGTNHSLPTNGLARTHSGVSVDSFVKKITFQKIDKKGIENIGKTVETMAASEGLAAHKNAVTIRLKKLMMEKFNLETLTRKNIKKLKPYSSARSEYTGAADVFLDANENSYGSPVLLPAPGGEGPGMRLHRYPDPLQWQLKKELSKIKGIPPQNIFIGNGSDEVIDIAFRIFCEPGQDNVIVCPPTYGMYKVCADINDVEAKEVLLTDDFQLDVEKILASIDLNTKLIFICSPNNPTGNNMHRLDVEILLNNFSGIVVIDEAYINFSKQKPFLRELTEYGNLIVMHTLSKAWGLAALRLGLGFASEKIIDLFNKVKPPYNINQSSQQLGLHALLNIKEVNANTKNTVEQRGWLGNELRRFDFIKKIFPSDANFILVKVDDADKLYQYLLLQGIIVRNRTKEPLCDNCIRITVGIPEENEKLIKALENYA